MFSKESTYAAVALWVLSCSGDASQAYPADAGATGSDAGMRDARAGDAGPPDANAIGDATVQGDGSGDAAIVTPKHVFTWDYGEGDYITPAGQYPTAGLAWLSLAQVSYGASSAQYHTQGIKVIKYTNGILAVGGLATPEQVFTDDNGIAGQAAQPSPDFVHDCMGNALTSTEGNYSWYIQDFSKTEVIANNIKDRVGTNFNQDFDYLFMDGPASESFVDVSTHVAAAPCGQTDAQFMTTLTAGYKALGVPIVINGLSDTQYTIGLPSVALPVAKALAGGRMEESYICPGNGEGGCANQAPSGAGYQEAVNHPIWQSQENTEIDMNNAGKLLLIEEYDANVDPASSTGFAHRMFGIASFLLTYVSAA